MTDLTIKDEFTNVQDLQAKLLTEIHILRLNIDLSLLNAEIANHQQVHASVDSNIFTKVTYGVKNEFNNIKTEKLNKEKDVTVKKLEEFSNKQSDYDEIMLLIDKTFQTDDHGVSKYLFAITLVNELKEYYYEDISLKTVSAMLFKDEEVLKKLRNNFKDMYVKIGAQSLSQTQKYALGAAAGIAFASSVLVAPLLLAALTIPFSVGALTLATVTGISATVGSTYAAMTIKNKTDLKKDFKAMSYDEITYVLTMKTMLLDHAFTTLPEDKFKEYLNDVLLMTSDLKADSLYYALVEKTETEKNEKLTDAYYRFDKQMLKKYKL